MTILTDVQVREALRKEWRWLDLIRLEAATDLFIVLKECSREQKKAYALRWSGYHVYGVRNESFIVMEERQDEEHGPLRELIGTTFLTYAKATTWQNDEELRHWQIAASNHVIDIAATYEPEVSFVKGDFVITP